MGSRSSTADPPASSLELIIVGTVRRPHGLRGEVVVEVLTDVPDRFAIGAELTALPPPGRPGPGAVRQLVIRTVRPYRGTVLLSFAGIEDRDEAQALRGSDLAVGPDRSPPLPPDTWYHFQLLGCRLIDRRCGDLGEVVALVEDGGGILMMVEAPCEEGRRRLPVPLVKSFLVRVDLPARRIEVELPEGLVELCASRS
jgi:16S rRNA processing protein RimM